MSKEDRKVVLAVFGALSGKSYDELNTFLGSVTIKEMQELYNALRFEEYCEENGVQHEGLTRSEKVDAYMDVLGYC